MSQQNLSDQTQNLFSAAAKPMITGGVIGIILISMFVFSVDHPRPEWGNLWQLKPLIITPLGGAMGGLLFFLVNFQGTKWGLNKYLLILAGIIGFIIALWMGFVLGLNGTLWN